MVGLFLLVGLFGHHQKEDHQGGYSRRQACLLVLLLVPLYGSSLFHLVIDLFHVVRYLFHHVKASPDEGSFAAA